MRLAASFTGFVPRETATMEKLDDVQYYLEVGGHGASTALLHRRH